MLFKKRKTKTNKKRRKSGAADLRARRWAWITGGMAATALVALGVLNWARSAEGHASLLRLGVDRYHGEVVADIEGVLAARFPDFSPATADSTGEVRRVVLEAPGDGTFWELQAGLAADLDAVGGRVMWGERMQRPRRRYGADPGADRAVLRLDVGADRKPTHVLMIHPRGTEVPDVIWGGDLPRTKASDLLGDLDTPTVAIVVDDWGNGDTAATRSMLKVDVPLTLSVLPGLRYSRRYALAATELVLPDHRDGVGKVSDATRARRWRRSRGCDEEVALGGARRRKPPQRRREVMLHLPMEPQGYPGVNPGERPIRVGMELDDIARIVDDALAGLPGVTGVNNHMGSAVTADRATMDRVAYVLAERGLFFIDSMTSSRSVAAAAARDAGIATLQNRMFLDQAETNRAQIERLLSRLVNAARATGSAVALCHPYPETVEVLRRELPRYRREGIRFVTVSEMLALEAERDEVEAARIAAAAAAPVEGAAP